MATVRLADSGQEFPLADEIAGNDEMLKSALRTVHPEIGEPQIKRESKDGQMVVTVVKQAGRKGAGTLDQVDAMDTADASLGLFSGEQPPWMAVQMELDAANEPLHFDYEQVDATVRDEVQAHARNIKLRAKRTVHDMIQIGKSLLRVKAALPHGQWLPWLKEELDLGEDTAGRFMQVAQKYGDNPQVGQYATSALYLLAAPSTPDSAREEAQARAETGEQVGTVAAREIVTTHRELQERAATTGEVQVLRQGDRSFTFEPDEPQVAGRFKPGLFDQEAVEREERREPEDIPPVAAAQAPAPSPAAPSTPTPAPVTSATKSPAQPAPPATSSQAAPTAPPAPIAAPAPPKPAVPPSYEQSTVTLSMLLYPEGKDPRGRLVMVSARVEGQRVFTTTVHWDDLQPMPAPILGVLTELEEQIEASRALAKRMSGGGSSQAESEQG